MSERKRKASASLDSRPKKRQEASTGPASIAHISSSDNSRPIIASIPGAKFPQDVRFRSFTRKDQEDNHILLHSSDHPTIDYKAVEGAESNERHLNHYVAVYDPATNKLSVTEAKSVTVRGSIRQALKNDEPDEEVESFTVVQGTRMALTEAFGSKRSKKAVQAVAENRQLGQGAEGRTIAEAITAKLDSEDDASDVEGNSAATAVARSNKPLPTPNLRTDNIDEVYNLSTLVHPSPASETLSHMPLNMWLARLKAGKEINDLRSRFAANRIPYLVKQYTSNPKSTEAEQQIQLLQYIELLVSIAHYVAKQGRFARLQFVEKWPEGTLSPHMPLAVAKGVMQKIYPEGKTSERQMTLLRTTIFALTLHIRPPSGIAGIGQLVTDIIDIQMDLAMDVANVRKLYHELGCTVKDVGERDLNLWGYTKLAKSLKKGKGDAGKRSKPMFAVLKFPLDFPKVSSGRRAKR